MKEINTEKLHNAAESLLDLFQSKEWPEQLGYAIIKRQGKDDRPCLKWSITNYLIMLSNHTTDARTYLQWRNSNRVPARSSHAFSIFGPIIHKIKDKDTNEEKAIIVGFKPINVFAKHSTVKIDESIPDADDIDYTPNKIPELSKKIIKVLESWGVTVQFKPMDRPGVLGYFRPTYNNGKGLICCSDNTEATICHETMHLLNSLEEDLSSISTERAELIAELGSAVLLHLEGVTGYEKQAYEYLKAYVGNDATDKQLIQKLTDVLQIVERCILRLLKAIEELDKNFAAEN